MCIIVAKNAGIKMPSMDTLRNCFDNNPDGAGFMLAAKNTVYGFKGLMTFKEFKQELSRAEKRFGNLDKLSVVLHFRISTHGSTVGGNTHPFPLKGGYREMRKTEWIADQGFAHNGIISHTCSDPDIKKHNVSDTMVFAKKFVNPIAKYATIASDTAIMDMLFDIADSKLCFLSKKGRISTRGHFVEQDGVLYSNTSFEERSYRITGKHWNYYYSYDADDVKTGFRLSKKDEAIYMDELAKEYGYYPLPEGSMIYFEDNTVFHVTEDGEYYIDDNGDLYGIWSEELDFYLAAVADEVLDIVFPLEEVPV